MSFKERNTPTLEVHFNKDNPHNNLKRIVLEKSIATRAYFDLDGFRGPRKRSEKVYK